MEDTTFELENIFAQLQFEYDLMDVTSSFPDVISHVILTALTSHLWQMFGVDIFVRQFTEDLLRPLADVTGTSEDKDERTQTFGHVTQGDVIANIPYRLAGHAGTTVVVG